MRTTTRQAGPAPRSAAAAWSRTGRIAGYVAGSALLAGTVLFLLDAAGLLGQVPDYHRTSAGQLADQAAFYASYFAHQHHVVWDIIARDTILPVAYLALIVAALAVRHRAGPDHPEGQLLVSSFLVGAIVSIIADLTFLAAAQYWRQADWPARPAASTVAVGRTVEGIQALTQWPEAFGFAVLACGLVALGRLCGSNRILPAPLRALAYLEALLLLGIAVTGLLPNDTGYDWLSLAAGAVVGPVLTAWLGTVLGRPQPHAAT